MIHIVWPWIFLFLPLPFLVRRVLPRAMSFKGAAVYAPFVLNTGIRSGQDVQAAQRKKVFLASLVWVLLVLAGVRPQWLGPPIELPESGRALMLAVDISGSMEVPDLDVSGNQVSRLDVVKEVAGDFIFRRSGDRLGLILFGTNAYIQAPLTFDRQTVRTLLEEAEIGMAGKNTAIGDALGLAVKRLRERNDGKAALILLTDGANTAGKVPPRQAADLAASTGLRIYTIGVGADAFRVQGLFGKRTVNPSRDLDEDTLRYIAEKTGGVYFRAKNKEGLEEIYEKLDVLEPVEGDGRVVRSVSSLYFYPLGAAFLLSIIWGLFTVRPQRRKTA